jgi:hypothetical protein
MFRAAPILFLTAAAFAQSHQSPLPPLGDARAVVLYFIASDCPISNRTLPEMHRIEHEFSKRNIRFFFVYPNATETPATLKAHEAAYQVIPPVLTDPDQQLARLTKAHVTPEAAILIPTATGLKSVFTGRIDDRNLRFGVERPAATHHDLEDALNALLANRPIPPPAGPPVGCTFVTR